MEIKVAAASGLADARKLCEEVESGNSPYQFIEIMACPGRVHKRRRAADSKGRNQKYGSDKRTARQGAL